MRKTLRPYMTAGVAVVGASVLAIAPVIATPPDVKVINPAVQQSAGPLDDYVETVREALENLEALLGSALALPAPTGWTLELALDNLFSDPGGNVQLFVDELEALGPLAGASVPALLDSAADAARTTVERAAEGNVNLAIASLIRTYVTLVPAVTAIVGAPLKLLGPQLGDAATVVFGKSVNAAVGPMLSGIGSTGVAIQNMVSALNDAEPGSGALLWALLAAPGTVLDGVLNGFAIVPGSMALPGLLTPGDPFDATKPDPGPVALAVGLARGLGSVAGSGPLGATGIKAPDVHRVVTLDVDDGTALPVDGGKTLGGADLVSLRDPDEGTNEDVVSADDGSDLTTTNNHGPRAFGRDPIDRSAGGSGLTTLRQGIRDGVREFRESVRDVVKTVTGRGRGAAAAGTGAGDEPAGP